MFLQATVRSAWLLTALAVACASAPPPAPAATAPPTPPPVAPAGDLPRSSIAAILAHREELGLTPDQITLLQRRDDALAREDEALRARIAAGSQPPATPSGFQGSQRGHGGGHRSSQRPPDRPRTPDALTQLDDNDTRAFLEVEQQVLTEVQRPRAEEIATRFREALYDQQHPSRVPHGSGADAGTAGR